MKKLFTLLLLLTTGTVFAAGPDKVTYEHTWIMRSVAALGMGDAFYVKSDNKYAPFYNPAGLTRVKGSKVDAFPLTVEVSDTARKFYNDFADIDTDNNTEVANLLRDHIGKNMYVSLSTYPAYVKENFVFGFFANSQVNMLVSNPVIPEIGADVAATAGLVGGYGMSFLDDQLQTGVSLKVFGRASFQRIYTVIDIVNKELEDFDANDEVAKGFGVLGDIGVIYNFYNGGLNPRVGLALNNVGTNGMGDVKDIPYTLNFSAGFSPYVNGIFSSDVILDVRDITKSNEDDDYMKRVKLGAEVRFLETVNWVPTVALRAGLNEGYPTVGLGLNFHYVDINYAYYREEMGAYAGAKESQRHALELVFGF